MDSIEGRGRHIHLDALGGVSGDMFVAALLDALGETAENLRAVLPQAGCEGLVRLEVERSGDGILVGCRVRVSEAPRFAPAVLQGAAAGGHPHRAWREIRELLAGSELDDAVKTHALGIFSQLASAEARVHGVADEEVTFHEVGAWDSIADVVCAAWLIVRSGAASWSVSSLPLGRGEVDSAHGRLPLPAPATALLLEGFECHDDGLAGERVTPTGAAILRHLAPIPRPATGLRLAGSGIGLGSRRLPGRSNALRALVFDTVAPEALWQEEPLLELAFELDDQDPEELALGLARLRALPAVLDLSQQTLQGKKGRALLGLRLLVRPQDRDQVLTACFQETATLGVRARQVSRMALPRRELSVEHEGRRFRAKLAWRPDGSVSAKAEADDLAELDLDREARRRLRREIEALALASVEGAADSP